MGTSVLHIKTEVECRVYLFDEEKGIAKPGTYFNLEVRKGEQDLLFVSTEDEAIICFKLYNVEEGDCDYRMSLEQSQFINVDTPATEEEISSGVKDEFGVVYSHDGLQLLKCSNGYNIREYHIQDGCKVIRGMSFGHCEKLTAITMPDNLTHVGCRVFAWCLNLAAITLPACLTHIGDNAFCCCEKLTSIALPTRLTHISNGVFGGCKNLTTITLPDSLTHIGDGAFEYCKNITVITLPASLAHIGKGSFAYSGIRTVISHSPHFSFQYGCLIDVQGKRLIAFLLDMADVTLPAGLTHIGDWAFEGCMNLSTVTLPASLTHIGDRAFRGCKNLTTITLPASLTHIGKLAFACSGIKTVVSYSPHFSFQDGCLIDVQGKRLIAFLSDMAEATLPAGLTHIGENAFEFCRNLISITLPAGLTYIGDGAFSGCFKLTAITLPDSLTYIADDAFKWCEKLTVIHIPQGMRAHFEALMLPYFHSLLNRPRRRATIPNRTQR